MKSVSNDFWERVNKDGPLPEYNPELGNCWIWIGNIHTKGYGQFRSRKNRVLAHRFSYELHNGNIDPNLNIDHLCRVRSCVRPTHLEQVSTKVNTLRGVGLTAINAIKQYCKNGHKFTKQNTYNRPLGGRTCRQCQIRSVLKYQKRKLVNE